MEMLATAALEERVAVDGLANFEDLVADFCISGVDLAMVASLGGRLRHERRRVCSKALAKGLVDSIGSRSLLDPFIDIDGLERRNPEWRRRCGIIRHAIFGKDTTKDIHYVESKRGIIFRSEVVHIVMV